MHLESGRCWRSQARVAEPVRSKSSECIDALRHSPCLFSCARSYETTIQAINSAVLKLSKLTRATKVYRGSQGATLPSRFRVADEFNVRGGVEVRLARGQRIAMLSLSLAG